MQTEPTTPTIRMRSRRPPPRDNPPAPVDKLDQQTKVRYGTPPDDENAPRWPPNVMDYDVFYFRGKKGEERVHAGRIVVLEPSKRYKAHMKVPGSSATHPAWELIGEFDNHVTAMSTTTEQHEKRRVKLGQPKKSRKRKVPKVAD